MPNGKLTPEQLGEHFQNLTGPFEGLSSKEAFELFKVLVGAAPEEELQGIDPFSFNSLIEWDSLQQVFPIRSETGEFGGFGGPGVGGGATRLDRGIFLEPGSGILYNLSAGRLFRQRTLTQTERDRLGLGFGAPAGGGRVGGVAPSFGGTQAGAEFAADLERELLGLQQEFQAREAELGREFAAGEAVLEREVSTEDLKRNLRAAMRRLREQLAFDERELEELTRQFDVSSELEQRGLRLRRRELREQIRSTKAALIENARQFDNALAFDKSQFIQELGQRQTEFGAEFGLRQQTLLAERFGKDPVRQALFALGLAGGTTPEESFLVPISPQFRAPTAPAAQPFRPAILKGQPARTPTSGKLPRLTPEQKATARQRIQELGFTGPEARPQRREIRRTLRRGEELPALAGGTADAGVGILVGEGQNLEGLKAGTAEILHLKANNEIEIIPLADRAQAGLPRLTEAQRAQAREQVLAQGFTGPEFRPQRREIRQAIRTGTPLDVSIPIAPPRERTTARETPTGPRAPSIGLPRLTPEQRGLAREQIVAGGFLGPEFRPQRRAVRQSIRAGIPTGGGSLAELESLRAQIAALQEELNRVQAFPMDFQEGAIDIRPGIAATERALRVALGLPDIEITSQGVLNLPSVEQAARQLVQGPTPVRNLLFSAFGVGGPEGATPFEEALRRARGVTPMGVLKR